MTDYRGHAKARALQATRKELGLGFWEEDNHGASSPDRRYGAWIETDDLPSPEEFDAWLAAHDAEIKAEALGEAAKEFASRLPDGTGNGRAYNSWRVSEILRARAAAIRGEVVE